MIDRSLIVCVLISSCLTIGLSTESQPPILQCLTGYMTDIQSWVSYNGKLTVPNGRNAIDVSYQVNCIRELQWHLQSGRCSRNNTVIYLSIARCQLRQVPIIFKFADPCRRLLSDTLQYLTIYGNNFGQESADTQYRVAINATSASTKEGMRSGSARGTWSAGFKGVTFSSLFELDLRLCGIQELEDNVFRGMPRLEKLYLGENNIFLIGDATFTGLRNLLHLDISRNYEYDNNGTYRGLYFDNWLIFQPLIALRSLDFSFTKMAQRNVIGFRSVSRHLERLSICHAGLSNFNSNYFSHTSLKYLDITGNINILGGISRLNGLENSLKVLYADEIALKSLDIFENITSLEVLRVANNEISTIGSRFAKNLKNLQVLVLDMNRLIAWFKPTVSLISNLKLLSIRDNNINLVSEEMAKDFGNVSYIGLSGNFIVCNCNVREIFELAMRNELKREEELVTPLYIRNTSSIMYHKGYLDANYMIATRNRVKSNCKDNSCFESPLEISGRFLLFDYDEAAYHCLLVTEGRSKSFAKVPSCRTARELEMDEILKGNWNRFYLLLIPLLMMPFLIFGFVFKRNFRYFCITMRNSMMMSLINKDEVINENTIFIYDVFVSYCNNDRAWVLDHLLPRVEKDCNVSICLHERDFLVGLSILENIISCIDRSKTIMLIISKKFLLSQWCQFEMHLAQHRLLETRREDLIIVLLEDVPRRHRPNTLHYLMLTNTYIVWPKEECEQDLFWRRLKKSVITHKTRQTDNVSLA